VETTGAGPPAPGGGSRLRPDILPFWSNNIQVSAAGSPSIHHTLTLPLPPSTVHPNQGKTAMSGIPITPQPFALTGPAPAHAALLWDWRYTGTGITARGTLTTTSRTNADGYYLISGITGSRNGEAITGLESAGDAIPGNPGFPVDNLISRSGQLTANGFGYETADGNFANPFYANFLTPATYQEVYTQPASSGFSELPIAFRAARVPGVTVATAAPGIPGDALSLDVIRSPRHGSLYLDGTAVQYMSGGHDQFSLETFSFDLKDRYGNATPVITVIAGGNGSRAVAGAASGHTDISLGNGNDIVTLSGGENTVTLGSGFDVVHGGRNDTIYLTGNAALAIHGTDEMVFAGGGNVAINDFSNGLRLDIGPASGHDVLMGFLCAYGFSVRPNRGG
jgi:hypothetical protein